jgi:hypothetical protein
MHMCEDHRGCEFDPVSYMGAANAFQINISTFVADADKVFWMRRSIIPLSNSSAVTSSSAHATYMTRVTAEPGTDTTNCTVSRVLLDQQQNISTMLAHLAL